jgi:hypothetical protein
VDAIPIWLLSEKVWLIVGFKDASNFMRYKIMELRGVGAFLSKYTLVFFLDIRNGFIVPFYQFASFIKSIRSVFK